MKFNLDDKPTTGPLFLYGLQWWVTTLPTVLILGAVASRLHFSDISMQTFYLQKVFWIMGITSLAQVLWGHKMPIVEGPAAILLAGIVATLSAGYEAIYTSILICGLLMALAAACGVLAKIRFLFTPRVIAVILILIAFTLTPSIIRLSFPDPENAAFNLAFVLFFVFAMLVANQLFKGVWKSLTLFIGLFGGSLVYILFRGIPEIPAHEAMALASRPWMDFFSFHPGAFLSFLLCFLALNINQLGSIESLGYMLKAQNMEKRVKRSQILEGFLNAGAGFMGVIGPVSYSMSTGIVAATGCASRFPMIPAAIAIFVCGFFPELVLVFSNIPGVVMGALLLYVMSTQFASGVIMLVAEKSVINFNRGITVAMPLMVGLTISFMPQGMDQAFPALFRPLVCNGFIMGTLCVLILEHLVFRKEKET